MYGLESSTYASLCRKVILERAMDFRENVAQDAKDINAGTCLKKKL